MPTRYLVLRADRAIPQGSDVSKPSAWQSETGGPTDLQINVYDGHEHDEKDLRADPRNAAVADADAMFSLVAPTARQMCDLTTLKPAGTLRMPEGLLAVNAHTSPFSGQGVTVAVLDTGIDLNHPAFHGKQLAMRDFTGEGTAITDVTDHNGHGTHCAATVCGAVVGDIRVGVAPGVTILCIGKVLGQRVATLDMLVSGILWAVHDENASIVSLSLGFDLPGNTKRLMDQHGLDVVTASQLVLRQQRNISEAIGALKGFLEVIKPNVMFVAATGNDSSRPRRVMDANLPASLMVAVGAVGSLHNQWEVASFSNGNTQIVAPGVDVVSAAPGGGWVTMSGTSMATPHVAGVAALWIEKLRNEGRLVVPKALVSELMASAARQVLADRDPDAIGVGMVQAPM